jgi:hypothetical protein
VVFCMAAPACVNVAALPMTGIGKRKSISQCQQWVVTGSS